MKMLNPDEEVTKPIAQEEPKSDTSSNIEYWPIDDLPSQYHLYPSSTKIYGRPLKVLEIKKLGLLNVSNSNFIITELLKAAIKGIEIDQLCQSDKLYIILWLRANTFREPGYSIDFYCDECKADASYDFRLKDIDVKYLDENFVSNSEITMKNGDKVTFGFLTIKDEKNIESFRKQYSAMELNEEVLDLACQIKTINGSPMPLMNKFKYLTETVDGQDYVRLETLIKKYDFGLKPVLNVKCNKCGGDTQAGLTFLGSFLVPKFRLGEDTGK